MSSSLVWNFQLICNLLCKRICAYQIRESKILEIRDTYGLFWKNPTALSMKKPGGLLLCAGADGRTKKSFLRNCTNATELKPSLLMRSILPIINISTSRVQEHDRT